VATAIRKLHEQRRGQGWTGTPTELLDVLREIAGDSTAKEKSWPKQPNHLSSRLRRCATFLGKVGITVESGRTDKSALRRTSGCPSDYEWQLMSAG